MSGHSRAAVGNWSARAMTVVATALLLPAAAAGSTARHLASAPRAVETPGIGASAAAPAWPVAVPSPLLEQHSRRGSSGGGGGQAVPRGGSSGGSSGGSGGGAVTRGGSSGGSADGGTSTAGGARTRGDSGAANGDGSGTPTYSRPREGRPATGSARERRPGDGGGTVIVGGGGYYGGFYPWGWGGLGLGGYYGYYDPWGFYDPYPPVGYAGGGYEGSLRLKVKPRDAEVYVDGYFAGEVDQYDGIFQRLHLEPGPHRIEIRMPGYEPLSFEVRILPDRTVTYSGEMQRDPTR